MAWEKRGTSHYYYRKKRDGSKVISKYVGRGKAAVMFAAIDAAERNQRTSEREEVRIELASMKKKFDTIDNIIDPIVDEITVLTGAFLVVNGYHFHKGQWRKKRDGKTDEN